MRTPEPRHDAPAMTEAADLRPRHFVTCARVPGGQCCASCHDDEDLGYDNLYIEDIEVGPAVVVGVRYCCLGRSRVRRRIDRLTVRLGGLGRRQ